VVEIVPASAEEVQALRVRQVSAIRRFLEAVATNRNTAGVSGLTGSVKRQTKTEQKTGKRAQGRAK
jgi:hypothetical protein